MNYYIILQSHKTSPTSFQFNGIPGEENSFNLPIESNSQKKLVSLYWGLRCGWISILKGKTKSKESATVKGMTKDALLTEIREHITEVPLSVTLEQLKLTITPEKIQDATQKKCESFRDQIARVWPLQLHNAVHLGYLKHLITDRLHEIERNGIKPRWMMLKHMVPPPEDYWRITVKEGRETHDGYCSDADCEVKTWKTRIYYLPVHNKELNITWKGRDIAEMREWYEPCDCGIEGGSGYCDTKCYSELLGFERIDSVVPVGTAEVSEPPI
jgi:hypothetical protein